MKSLSDRVLSVKIIVLWKDSWKQNNHMIWLFNTLELLTHANSFWLNRAFCLYKGRLSEHLSLIR